MIEALIAVLVALLVLVVIVYIVKLGAAQFGLPPVIVQIVALIAGLIWLLYALRAFHVVGPW